MAYVMMPADDRWGKMGQNLNQGLMMMMQNKLIENRQQKRRDDMLGKQKEYDQFKRDQQQLALDKKFGAPAYGSNPDNPVFVDGEINPSNTGLTSQAIAMMKGGIDPMALIPKNLGFTVDKFGRVVNKNTGAVSGDPMGDYTYKDNNIFQNGKSIGTYETPANSFAPSEFQKLVSQYNGLQEGDPRRAMIKKRMDYMTTRPMSAFDKAFMAMNPELFQGMGDGNTTNALDVNNFFENE